MRELPILFSAPMVRAILDGRKTVTRRLVKHQPTGHHWAMLPGYIGEFRHEGADLWHFAHRIPQNPHWDLERQQHAPCAVGDRIYVRETALPDFPKGFTYYNWTWAEVPDEYRKPEHVIYRASWDGSDLQWHPSIHMPKWAARIWLEVIAVRVERVQDITDEQARCEGVQLCEGGAWDYNAGDWHQGLSSSGSFATLWDSINGAGSWAENPWVWAVEFKRVEVPRG